VISRRWKQLAARIVKNLPFGRRVKRRVFLSTVLSQEDISAFLAIFDRNCYVTAGVPASQPMDNGNHECAGGAASRTWHEAQPQVWNRSSLQKSGTWHQCKHIMFTFHPAKLGCIVCYHILVWLCLYYFGHGEQADPVLYCANGWLSLIFIPNILLECPVSFNITISLTNLQVVKWQAPPVQLLFAVVTLTLTKWIVFCLAHDRIMYLKVVTEYRIMYSMQLIYMALRHRQVSNALCCIKVGKAQTGNFWLCRIWRQVRIWKTHRCWTGWSLSCQRPVGRWRKVRHHSLMNHCIFPCRHRL